MKRTAAVAITALAVYGQDSSGFSLKRKPDIGVFGGFQKFELWRSPFKNNPGSELISGGVLGARANWDFSRRWGGEFGYGYGVNNLRLLRQGLPSIDFGARNHHLSLNPVFHLMGPDSKIRPFVTAGVGVMWFNPTGDARQQAQRPELAVLGTGQLDTKTAPAFNWGGGVKYNMNRLLQLRLDARNVLTQWPHFMLPGGPPVPGGVFIAQKGVASGLQLTGGVGLRLSGGYEASKAKRFKLNLATEGSKVLAGVTRTVTASTDLPSTVTPQYQWTRNGQATGEKGPVYNFTETAPGNYQICAAATECVQFEVTEPPKPMVVTVSSNQTQLLPDASAAVQASSNTQGASFRWTVNGSPVPGTGANYQFNAAGRAPGSYRVCATGSAPGQPEGTGCTTIVVRDCGKPGISIPGGSSEIMAGTRSNLPFSATPNACGTPVQISYQTSEGTVTQQPGGAMFDSSSVRFDMTDRSKLRQRTVTVTATAKDQYNNTATAQHRVTVKLPPMAQRLDDLVFAQGSSRVNNCAKRLLLDVLAQKLQQDPNSKVVLIGYSHESESRTREAVRTRKGGRRVARPVQIDRSRVLNAAAALSAGKATCASIDMSRIKVSFAGTATGSEPRVDFCGASTRPRSALAVKPDPRITQRRVEIWIVPDGAAMPSPGSMIGDAPTAAVKALGCPR